LIWPSVIAYIGLVLVLPLAGWAFLVGLASAAGIFDNSSASQEETGGRLAVIACIIGVAAVVGLVGLFVNSQLGAVAAGAVLSGVALYTLADDYVFQLAGDNNTWVFKMLLVLVIIVGVATIFEARRRSHRGDGGPSKMFGA
jgi:hypothetical protein